MSRFIHLRGYGLAWLAAATVSLVAIGGVMSQAAHEQAAAKPATQKTAGFARELSQSFRNAAHDVLPSVVTIRRISTPEESSAGNAPPLEDHFRGSPFEDLLRDPYFRRFFEGMPSAPEGRQVSVGSGVIVDPSGIILSNAHVVSGPGKVMVRLHDGREFAASKVKTDPRTDVAVVWIEGAGTLPAARLGDSDALEVGDWVLAVGNPFGLEETVTAGIISAKWRGPGIAQREDFLQTDAAINPGNSGGPLINLDGEVVGINTAITTNSGGYEGVGFAIPAKLAKWVSDELVAYGEVRRAYLGIAVQPLTQKLAKQFKVGLHEGVLVSEVVANSPAQDAGLKTGDVLVKFAGQKIEGPRDLQAVAEQAPIGSREPIVVVRDGKTLPLEVTMRQQPADYGLAMRSGVEPGTGEKTELNEVGIEVQPLTPARADSMHMKGVEGVDVSRVRPGSPADFAGMAPSTVITEVGHKPVKNMDDFRLAMKSQSLAKGILFRVQTPEGARYVVIQAQA